MPLPAVLEGNLRLPLIGAPMFIVSVPDLVVAQCTAGIVGSFPALNARPQERLEEWIVDIKARLAAYEKLRAEEKERVPETVEIYIPPGPRLGDVVIEANGLEKAFGDKLLVDGLSFKLPPGGIVGVIGPNGAGKTTLFRMIVGQETPDAGSIEIVLTSRSGIICMGTRNAARTPSTEMISAATVIRMPFLTMASNMASGRRSGLKLPGLPAAFRCRGQRRHRPRLIRL